MPINDIKPIPQLTADFIQRKIWGRIAVGNPNDCWPISGWKTKRGYGMAYVPNATRAKRNTLNGKRAGGQQCMVARLIYMVSTGKDPGQLLITHSCDNPPCCNPNHLVAGTQEFNMLDAKSKGRTTIGERHGMAILKRKSINKIKSLYANGMSQSAISRIYGVTRAAIGRVVRNETWKGS